MKSPTISANRENSGFLIPEIMIAFSLMTLFLISALVLSTSMHRLHDQAVSESMKIKQSASAMDYFMTNHAFASTSLGYATTTAYGNDTKEIKMDLLDLISSDYQTAWGRDNCNPRISFDPAKVRLYSGGINLGSGNPSTDIEARDGFVYLTADSATASAPDFYIIDATNPSSPRIVSSLNTGPGLSALEVAGHYVYAANAGSTNQLQIIDISDRNSPILLSKLKLPLPFASSTAPSASSVFYSKGLVYLGTQKWDGNEFAVIDVSNPANPVYIGGFKTDTLVNDMYVRDGLAYLASSDQSQMRILDVHNPASIFLVNVFSPSGWETQEGKSLSYFEGKFSLGRTTGGFNVLTNYEIFTFSTTSPLVTQFSHDIPGGIYGMVLRPPNMYLATRLSGHEFQVWDSGLTQKIYEKPLGFLPHGFSCDASNFYFGTGDQNGMAVLTTQ